MADVKTNLKKAWMKSMEAIGSAATNIASNTRYKVDEMNMVNRRREILTDFGAQAYAMWQKGVTFPEELAAQLKELSELDEKLNALRTERLAGVETGKQEDEATAPQAPDTTTADAFSEVAEPSEEAPAAQDADVPVMQVAEPQAPNADEAVTPSDDAKAAEDVPVLEVQDHDEKVDELIAKGQQFTEQVKQTITDADLDGKIDDAMDKMSDSVQNMSDAIDKKLADSQTQQKVDGAIDKMNDTMTRMGSALGKAMNSMADMLKGDKKDDENK